jgi:hypothetical protein
MKWKWKKYQSDPLAYIAKKGQIELDVWQGDEGEWLLAFDLKFDKNETTSKYFDSEKDLCKAKKKLEKFAEKWIHKFNKSLK